MIADWRDSSETVGGDSAHDESYHVVQEKICLLLPFRLAGELICYFTAVALFCHRYLGTLPQSILVVLAQMVTIVNTS